MDHYSLEIARIFVDAFTLLIILMKLEILLSKGWAVLVFLTLHQSTWQV